MGRIYDVRGLPGDLVMLRLSTGSADLYDSPSPAPGPLTVVGRAYPRTLGLILSVAAKGWTYVLWSKPLALGWIYDGELQTVRKRK